MNIRSVRLVYFSPTGGTRRVLEQIAAGTGVERVTRLDLTLPGAPNDFGEAGEDELLLLGAPVYAGRVPEIAMARFAGLRSLGGPAVLVAVYGNRAIEDALQELSALARAAGCVPVAGASFVAEHSYSTGKGPIAAGRPDREDLERAREFGREIAGYLGGVESAREIPAPELPGNPELKGRPVHPALVPTTDPGLCIACGACEQLCPTGSITTREISETNEAGCILCAACVKGCAFGARALQGPFIKKIREWLGENAAGRREPEIFMHGPG
ncbi:MAG: 4Fe-4S binding protein [Acidobacteria bacterium]|nr:4Fe-4S binding protein [Acidobacteriota bacterium]